MAFSPFGKYQFKRKLFGLNNAPSIFSDLLNGMTDCVATYMDDFAVFLQSWEEHAGKCTVGANSCIFLGHKVGGGRIKPLE